MRKIFVSTFTLLALTALIAFPAFAADVEGDLEVVLVEEELFMTPAESAELQELLDPSQDLLENKIADCSGEDWRCPDPENCRCLAVTVTQVYCDCS